MQRPKPMNSVGVGEGNVIQLNLLLDQCAKGREEIKKLCHSARRATFFVGASRRDRFISIVLLDPTVVYEPAKSIDPSIGVLGQTTSQHVVELLSGDPRCILNCGQGIASKIAIHRIFTLQVCGALVIRQCGQSDCWPCAGTSQVGINDQSFRHAFAP